MKLGEVMRKWRTMEDRGVREVAKEIGMSSSTLCRFEGGKPIDSSTFAKILYWLVR